MAFLHAGDRRHDLSWGAITALKSIVVDEGLLHRMQGPVGRGKAFNRRDLLACDAGGERQAGKDSAIIDQHGASPALAMVTAFLTASQTDVLAQGIKQHGADIEL
jgi:type II secretory pathway predicted ATPase ExeA